MNSSPTEKSIISLGAWLETPVGSYVRSWEQARFDELTSDIFGFNAVQIGLPQVNALQSNRMPNKWITDTAVPSEEAKASGALPVVVVHDYAELPFASQSLDLVVLPHVLEFSDEPHQVLREVERVLIPEGQLIICGFNSASLWGMRQVGGGMLGSHFLPHGEFISLLRMKDWLKLLNMEVNRGHFGCYAPPCHSTKWLQRFSFMEKAGDRWWPYLGAIYMVQAVKRVQGMRLIGPAWSKQQVKAGKGMPVANRIHKKTD